MRVALPDAPGWMDDIAAAMPADRVIYEAFRFPVYFDKPQNRKEKKTAGRMECSPERRTAPELARAQDGELEQLQILWKWLSSVPGLYGTGIASICEKNLMTLPARMVESGTLLRMMRIKGNKAVWTEQDCYFSDE